MKNRTWVGLWGIVAIVLWVGAVQAQTRILPLGDSVTSSFAPYSSYRYWLWHYLTDNPKRYYNVDFVGTQSGVAEGSPARTDYDQDHEGHPGWTSQDGLENIDFIANATQPDVVLLDLGANDVEQGVDPAIIIGNLQGIIEHLRAVNPNVAVLLAEPTPYTGDNSRGLSKFKGAIARLAKQEDQKRGSRVLAVNLFGGFSVRKYTFDGTHPNERGEQFIAKKYFAVLKKVLPRPQNNS